MRILEPLRPYAMHGLVAGALCMGVLAALLQPRVRGSKRLRTLVHRLPGWDLAGRVLRTSYQALTNPLAVIGAVLVSALAHSVGIGIFYAVSSALGDAPTLLEQIFVVPVGMVINALPGAPGGLGIGELAFETLFDLVLGTTHSNGAESCIIWRSVLTVCFLLGGLVYFFAPPTERTDETPTHRDLIATLSQREQRAPLTGHSNELR